MWKATLTRAMRPEGALPIMAFTFCIKFTLARPVTTLISSIVFACVWPLAPPLSSEKTTSTSATSRRFFV